jgi:hypothetical protein
MVGFMNREALETTLRTGFVTFYSRTRRTLWTKGETSGNRLEVVAAWTDWLSAVPGSPAATNGSGIVIGLMNPACENLNRLGTRGGSFLDDSTGTDEIKSRGRTTC